MTPTELWLPIGAAAFYLYDSSCLLWQNELMFTKACRWLVTGGTELRLAGRRLYLPNPLTPLRPQFQVRWSLADTRAESADIQKPLQALRPIGVINQLQLLLLLALPVLAWTLGAGLLLLLLFILFYVLSLLALALTWHNRIALRLTTGRFWLLVLDALACAPFAVNMTRKLSMQHGIAGDPLHFAAHHYDAAGQLAIRQIIASRLQEECASTGVPADAQATALLISRLKG